MEINKNMTNTQIAHLLNSVAAAYEIKDEDKNKFRIKAYQKAADAIEHLSVEAKDLWDDNELEEVGGIGKSIADHLGEIFKKGKSKHFSTVMKGIKPATFKLMKVSGIGPKTAYKLTEELNITSERGAFERLKDAAEVDRIAEMEGFGEDSQSSILQSLREIKERENRMLLSYAESIAEEIIDWMKRSDDVERADTLGSLRRKAATIGDIDISVASNEPKKVVKHFESYGKSTRTLEKGDRDASILLPGDVRVDLKIQEPDSYGSLLQHFTGSKHHNIALREYAQKKDLSLSEYGIKKGKGKKLVKFREEKEFYEYLKMAYIPPELREAQGEIEAARNDYKGKASGLPKLVELNEVKADLQIHSDFDIETSHDLGESSMKDIVKYADNMGYEYIAFTEHNPSQAGHKEKDVLSILKKKKEDVDKINYSVNKGNYNRIKKVYNSLEIDILPDGKLPVSDKGLDLLDFALISIHSSFRQSRKKMTKRILRAFDHPKVKIFAHPTGRKINHREGVEMEWDEIFNFCKEYNKWLEINADPMRLDLPDAKVKDAVAAGVKMSIGTDSHHVDSMINIKYGVYVARRGWAEAGDIVNTRSLEAFEKMLK
jgi:DNA polymerase (family 10)